MKDVVKMDAKERQAKMQELRFSLVKSQVTAHKATAKTKEIKRTLARLLTFNNSAKEALNKK
jgi:ribosomal protein L29